MAKQKLLLTPEQREAVRTALIHARQDDNGNLSDGDFADSVLKAHFDFAPEEVDVSSRLANISPIEQLDREDLVKALKRAEGLVETIIWYIPRTAACRLAPNYRWGQTFLAALEDVILKAKIEVLEELATKQGALVKEVTDLWMNTPHWKREPRPESLRYGYAERVCRDKILTLKQEGGQ